MSFYDLLEKIFWFSLCDLLELGKSVKNTTGDCEWEFTSIPGLRRPPDRPQASNFALNYDAPIRESLGKITFVCDECGRRPDKVYRQEGHDDDQLVVTVVASCHGAMETKKISYRELEHATNLCVYFFKQPLPGNATLIEERKALVRRIEEIELILLGRKTEDEQPR